MPVIDGIEATSHVRRSEAQLKFPKSSIVAITAADCEKGRLRSEYRELGFDQLVSKPISRKEFHDLLAKYIF